MYICDPLLTKKWSQRKNDRLQPRLVRASTRSGEAYDLDDPPQHDPLQGDSFHFLLSPLYGYIQCPFPCTLPFRVINLYTFPK